MSFPVGISNFKELRQGEYQFVDKTLFIKEVMNDGAKVIVITRPRRFGKTMNMSMLRHFLSYGEENLFEGLAISEDKEFCLKHQNQYPVIFVTFKDIKFNNYELAYEGVAEIVSDLYEAHKYLLEGELLSDPEKRVFEAIRNKQASQIELQSSIKKLMKFVLDLHGKAPIFLIDEYDTPIHSAYAQGYYEDMIDLMRGILGNTLKDNDYLGKAIVTGITRVAKESLFSGVNNLEVYTLLRKDYGQYFGFTEEEVRSLMPVNSSASIEVIKDWYNGYQIGSYQVYNPWSIINYCKHRGKPQAYWVNTSDNALVYKLIEGFKPSVKLRFERLIQGETEQQILSDTLTFAYLKNDENAIWTLLVHTGYLNVLSSKFDERGRLQAIISVPNKEVMAVYDQLVENWFMLTNQASNYYEGLIDSLSQGNVEVFKEHVAEYIRESGSYFDFNNNTPERVFHVFMLGLLVGLRGTYEIHSNKEAGHGRYDIIFIPKDLTKNGIILEFKVCNKVKELGAKAKEAVEQIKQKQYMDAFKQKGIESVLVIGMAFCGKELGIAYTLESTKNNESIISLR